MRKGKTKQKGITLIALVITIIVLLILAGVSIATLTGQNGVLTQAQNAKEETRYATVQEEKSLWIMGGRKEKASDIINNLYNNNIITESERDKLLNEESITIAEKEISIIDDDSLTLLELYNEGTIKIGDYIDYSPNTNTINYESQQNINGDSYQIITREQELKWRVLGLNEDKTKLLIISDIPTEQTIKFSGAIGYNNAINELNTICERIYSNSEYGEARSINMKDIEEKSNFDYTKYSHSWSSMGYKYGQTANSISELYYPDSNSETGISLGKKEYFASYYGYNNYAYNYGDCGNMKDVMSCELLLGRNAEYRYWVADKCQYLEYGSDNFFSGLVGVQYFIRHVGESRTSYATITERINNGGIGGKLVYDSDNQSNSQESAIRPIIELNTDCYLDYKSCGEPSYINSIVV